MRATGRLRSIQKQLFEMHHDLWYDNKRVFLLCRKNKGLKIFSCFKNFHRQTRTCQNKLLA
jgi:phosphatidylserine decarboxylase